MIQIILFIVLLIAFIYWIKIHSNHPPRKGYLKPDEVSLPLKVINAISDASVATFGYTPVQVSRKKIIKMAEEVAAITDETIFGKQDEFLKGVSLFVNGLKQDKFSASGTILLNGFLQNTIRTRKRVVEYINAHPEVLLNTKFEEPFVISGLPRTGSTLLYNLMACDPKSRSPRFYEMSACVNIMPPVPSKEQSKTHPRIHEAVKRFELIEKMYPNYFKEANKSHYIHPAEIEEDILVMYQSYVLQSHWPLSGKEFQEWYEDDTNKEAAYKFHQRFFQLLSYYWNPESHWLLKAPVHSTYLKALYNQYPKAKMIITHRDPNSVVPSWIRLNEAYINWNYNDYQLNRAEFGKDLSDSLVLCAKRIMEFTSFIDQKCEKENVANNVYINVVYEDLMKDPIETVRNIYNFFNVPFSDEFRENMEKYLKENQQGKHGRREYTLEDYSLTTQEIQKDFKEYISFFNVPVK